MDLVVESFGETVRRLRTERGIGLRELARAVPIDPGHLSRIEHGMRPATPEIVAAIEAALLDDEFDAYELAQRAQSSDVGATALAGLESAFARLAIAYQRTPPSVLLPDVRRQLRYVVRFLDNRATLAQRRRLLVIGGWLSMLAATLHIDLHQRGAAAARLRTAAVLARQAEHREIAAWVLETRAWDALTEGDFPRAVELARAGQEMAPRGGSAHIQATAQEGRAHARLGDGRATRDALNRVARLVSPLSAPDQPEHHYQYDPAKQLAYTATTLSWVGDPAAEAHAREVIAQLGTARPRRVAAARLDLALALAASGRYDEAVGETLLAIGSGRIVPSNAWRAIEVVDRVQAAGLPEAAELREAVATLDQ